MTPQELVEREVIYCVSGLIYDLREVAEKLDDYDTYLTLTGGKPDYEEAARNFIEQDADFDQLVAIVAEYDSDDLDMTLPFREAVRKLVSEQDGGFDWVCDEYRLDPEYGEIYEHWIVTGWLGDRLRSRGHVVEEYLGLTIWGRGCTGQAVCIDNVIEDICKEMNSD